MFMCLEEGGQVIRVVKLPAHAGQVNDIAKSVVSPSHQVSNVFYFIRATVPSQFQPVRPLLVMICPATLRQRVAAGLIAPLPKNIASSFGGGQLTGGKAQ